MTVIGGERDAMELGTYLARDGSRGGPVGLDIDRAHAGVVVGKRGSGKSYTLGVLAEALAARRGVTPVVCDPMGAFEGLAAAGLDVVRPRVRASALDGRAWCDLLGLAPTSGAGALVWASAGASDTLAGMHTHVERADAPASDRQAAVNHLQLAADWGVFDPDGLTVEALHGSVLALQKLDRAPANAVVRAVASALYRARLEGAGPLPWLLVDEAHGFFEGVAGPALRRLFTRGRAPGVSVVAATQRPAALPDYAISQADLLVAHRLTGAADRERLARARPSYLPGSLADRLPDGVGEALVFDDATGRAHAVRIRERRTDHGGATARADEGDAVGAGQEPKPSNSSAR
ncbi:ATP-binding protein [Natronomonas sp. EA1]|uniref:ATP-binding protein n=1 Tax=Natronomonas sp. EA1 TaxID=3421655 RepID=UPI003EBC1AE6